MNRGKTLLIVGVLLLLVTATGCGAQPNTSGVTTSSFDYPPGYSETGIVNTTAAIETHTAALDRPYVVSFSVTKAGARGTSTVTGYIEAVPSHERAFISLNRTAAGRFFASEIYRNRDTVYRQQVAGDTFEYDVERRPFRRPIYGDRRTFHTMIAALNMTASTVLSRNDTHVVRYRVRTVSAARMTTTIHQANGTVIVSETGRIRSIRLSFVQYRAGVERTVWFRYTTTETNVTVTRPGWIDEARASKQE
jgi:hypothetical protein